MLPDMTRLCSVEDIGTIEQGPDSSRSLFELVRTISEKFDRDIFETIEYQCLKLTSVEGEILLLIRHTECFDVFSCFQKVEWHLKGWLLHVTL